MSKYTIAWIIWIAWFLLWEFMALRDKAKGDTLSEHIWWLRDNGGTLALFMLAGFLGWMMFHFLLEGGRQ